MNEVALKERIVYTFESKMSTCKSHKSRRRTRWLEINKYYPQNAENGMLRIEESFLPHLSTVSMEAIPLSLFEKWGRSPS